jgi:hypothetical protein
MPRKFMYVWSTGASTAHTVREDDDRFSGPGSYQPCGGGFGDVVIKTVEIQGVSIQQPSERPTPRGNRTAIRFRLTCSTVSPSAFSTGVMTDGDPIEWAD